MSNSSKQIKFGALMSYFTIAFNMLAGLIYTPWMIEQIGQSNYGLYTLTTSLISLFVVDFGMGAAVARFVSKYNAEGNQEKVNNFLGIVYKLYLAIDAVILLVLVVVGFFTNDIYNNLTASELETFKVLYVIVGLFSVVSFPFANLNGILTAYEQFVGLKIADLFHKIFIIVFMVIALLLGYGVYALVIINAVSGLLTIAIKLIIVKRKTAIKVNFRYKDRGILKEIFGFSVWTTVSSVAQRLLLNVTPSIIVAVSATGAVGAAIFGVAGTIEGYVFLFSTALSGMFMTKISRIVNENDSPDAVLPLMIKVGRMQFIIVGFIFTVFAVIGESFIVNIWNKPDFAQSYWCALLVISPHLLLIPMEIAYTLLIVKNEVRIAALIGVVSAVANMLLALVLARSLGALGASISIFFANTLKGILYTFTYHKRLGLNMFAFFKETYLKLMACFGAVLAVALLITHFNPVSNVYIKFISDGILITVVFAAVMLIFGFNEFEKGIFMGVIRRFKCVKRRKENNG